MDGVAGNSETEFKSVSEIRPLNYEDVMNFIFQTNASEETMEVILRSDELKK